MARYSAETAPIYLNTTPSPKNNFTHQHHFPDSFADLRLFSLPVIHTCNTPMSDYTTKDSVNSASFDQREEASTEHVLKMDLKRRTSVAGQPAHQEHGPLVDHKIPQSDAVQAQPDLAWSRIRRTFREPLSEFFGVFILILFGDGVVAQVVLSNGTKGDYQSISWGWGLGVMLGVYTGGISGAHLNPAVTFANCVYRKFPWRKFPIYSEYPKRYISFHVHFVPIRSLAFLRHVPVSVCVSDVLGCPQLSADVGTATIVRVSPHSFSFTQMST